jgi:hypothetical protein
MSYATAAETTSVRLIGGSRPTSVIGVPRHRPQPSIFARQLSDTKQERDVREIRPIPATWFSTVQRRIQRSIVPPGRNIDDDRRWLTQDVADAASKFFRATSDVLPGEPHIYSSLRGDLVAEFAGAHGTMTNIVSQSLVVVFAVIDGAPAEKRLEPGRNEIDTFRQELNRLTIMLQTGRHGKVESED